MTARQIQWHLATHPSSPFRARQQTAVVPNVSWGFDLLWEADLLVLTERGYLTEIEIKISLPDWKADLRKKKHKSLGDQIKRFYYCAPESLAARHSEVEMPAGAGVLSVEEPTESNHGGGRIRVLKPAITRPHRKLTQREINCLLRLAAIKAWGLAHDVKMEDICHDDKFC